jgi:hypothetical protein
MSRLPVRERAVALLVLAASAVVAFTARQSGDYYLDPDSGVGNSAGPALDALAEGRVGRALELQPWMGAFSLILRLPFVALARALSDGDLLAYRAGVFPCVLALGLLGLAHRREMLARGASEAAGDIATAVCLLNPLTFLAIRAGHPEELLGAALCAGAGLAALRARAGLAGALLGLALATKQWALLAALPVLLAAPRERIRVVLIAAAVAAALTAPLLAEAGRLVDNNRDAARARTNGPTNVWTPFAREQRRRYFDGTQFRTATGYRMPEGLSGFARGIVVVMPLPLAWLFWRRRRPGDADALALLAVVLLLRCMLDPVNNGYYHVPFVLALACWEAITRRRAPVLALLASAAVWVSYEEMGSRDAITAVYAAWALPLLGWLVVETFALGTRTKPPPVRRRYSAA